MKKPAAMPRTQAWLNGSERARLQVLEVTIERGARMFIEMGKALAEIRDSRLYRESHDSFDTYCRERWSLSRRRVDELIQTAGIATQVSGIPLTSVPANPAVARELAPLRDDPGAMQSVWDEAVEKHGPTPTAAQVREIRSPAPDTVQHTSSDTRFELIDDAVTLLRLLPDPDAIAFPGEPGDLDVVTDALAWMGEWLPKARAALKRHVAEQRRRPRAVA